LHRKPRNGGPIRSLWCAKSYDFAKFPVLWRKRRVDNGAQVSRLAGLAMKRKPSVDFSGYWQRHKEEAA
jgi:hypothetical protein